MGTLFLPPAAGPHPVVVVMGGSDGGLAEGGARALAEEGFAALALAYFGGDLLPEELVEIPLEYFERAIAWLGGQPEVDAERIAVMGSSKGGELALVLGATYPEHIRAVVGYSPSAVAWQGISNDPRSFLASPRPSWTLGGEPVPFARLGTPGLSDFIEVKSAPAPVWPFAVAWPESRYPFSLKSTYEGPLEDGSAVAAGRIPVENVEGAVLLVSGTDDRLWPSTRFSEMVVERLEANGHAYPYEHLRYEGAGHLPSVPYSAPITTQSGPIDFGGTLEANRYASADSWERVLDFLEEHLKLPARA